MDRCIYFFHRCFASTAAAPIQEQPPATVESDGAETITMSHAERLRKQGTITSSSSGIAPRTNNTDGTETNLFNESHFDRLRDQGIITFSASGIAPRTNNTDGTETNVFNESHFERLREQGVIKCESHPQNDGPDRCGDFTPQRKPLHELAWEWEPQARIVFQQPEGDTRIILSSEQLVEALPGVPGDAHLLAVKQSRAEMCWSCHAGRILVTMYPIPGKEEVLVKNETTHPLFLDWGLDEIDTFMIIPQQYGTIYPGFWQLRDNELTLEFLLRPSRYRLFLQDEASKRTANNLLPPSKRTKHFIRADEVTEAAESLSDLAQEQKSIIRPTGFDVDVLASIGLGKNQALNMVYGPTGRFEYSIKRIDEYLKRGPWVDVFKALWKNGSSQPVVVAVKLHKFSSTAKQEDIVHAAYRWKRELQVHRHLEHVR